MSRIEVALEQQAVEDSLLSDNNIVGDWRAGGLADHAQAEEPAQQPDQNAERLAEQQTDGDDWQSRRLSAEEVAELTAGEEQQAPEPQQSQQEAETPEQWLSQLPPETQQQVHQAAQQYVMQQYREMQSQVTPEQAKEYFGRVDMQVAQMLNPHIVNLLAERAAGAKTLPDFIGAIATGVALFFNTNQGYQEMTQSAMQQIWQGQQAQGRQGQGGRSSTGRGRSRNSGRHDSPFKTNRDIFTRDVLESFRKL